MNVAHDRCSLAQVPTGNKTKIGDIKELAGQAVEILLARASAGRAGKRPDGPRLAGIRPRGRDGREQGCPRTTTNPTHAPISAMSRHNRATALSGTSEFP
jgi:hypothetical protein